MLWSAIGLRLKGALAALLSYLFLYGIYEGNWFYTSSKSNKRQSTCYTTDKTDGECVHVSNCARFFDTFAHFGNSSPCEIPTSTHPGICCPLPESSIQDAYHYAHKSHLGSHEPYSYLPPFTPEDLNGACERALKLMGGREEREKQLTLHNVIPFGSSEFYHAKLFQTNERIYMLGKSGVLILLSSLELAKRFSLSRRQSALGLPRYSAVDTIIKGTCSHDPPCFIFKKKYRSVDGSCNNMLHGEWGRAGSTLQRLLPPEYNDGLNEPRFSVSGRQLPSSRLISSVFHSFEPQRYGNFTMALMQWGQFLDHDIVQTPVTKGPGLSDISCCKAGHFRAYEHRHPECFPINVPPNDLFYAQFNQVCMEFVRSMPAIRPNCTLGPREQMNQVTSYIDASTVYGSSEEETREIRSYSKGKLKVGNLKGSKGFLPLDDCKSDSFKSHSCFRAGDARVNEQLQLTVMHTIWHREHNRVVQQLLKVNPRWDDEALYQEARRIVIAQIQHITYNEFLPILLGRQFVESYGLIPLSNKFFDGYRDDVDSTIINAFSTAAFRFGHSLVSNEIRLLDEEGKWKIYQLSSLFFNSSAFEMSNSLGEWVRGLVRQSPQKTDRFITTELTTKLFASNQPFGLDLMSLNIQRGRDHGLPQYYKWREYCGLKPIITFADLLFDRDQITVDLLRSLYYSVDDIDLFVGGISERPITGAILGPTFHCIVAKQFIKLKIGDRFFYENIQSSKYGDSNYVASFSMHQLKEIRRVSLARILCDNSNVKELQPLVFLETNNLNTKVSCSDFSKLPNMSFLPWKDEK